MNSGKYGTSDVIFIFVYYRDCGSGTHVDYNKGSAVFPDTCDGIDNEVAAKLTRVLHMDVKSCFQTGADGFGRFAYYFLDSLRNNGKK